MTDFCPHAKPSLFDPDRTCCLNPNIHSTRCIHSACPLYKSPTHDPYTPTSTPHYEPPPHDEFPHTDTANPHDHPNSFLSETQLSLF